MRPLSLLVSAIGSSNIQLFTASSAGHGVWNSAGGGTFARSDWIGRISSSVVYAVGYTNPGSVATFAVNDNSLQHLSTISDTQGIRPAHAGVVGKLLIVANYAGPGSVAYKINSDGSLASTPLYKDQLTFTRKRKAPVPSVQGRAHPHFVLEHPDGKHAIICDLGLDQIHILSISSGTKLSVVRSVNTKDGDGPRHAAFTSDGKTLYVVNELANSVSSYSWSSTGNLKFLASVSTLPSGASRTDNAAAEIVIAPDDAFVYATSRNNSDGAASDFSKGRISGDAISIFSTNKGHPKLVRRVFSDGIGPRGFVLSPSSQRAVATNEDSGSLTVFDRDSSSGALTNPVNFPAPSPSSFQPVSAVWLAE